MKRQPRPSLRTLLDSERDLGQREAAERHGVDERTWRRWKRALLAEPASSEPIPAQPSEPWRGDRARIVPASTHSTTEIVAFISDVHAPHHSEEALRSALSLIRAASPHRVVINGDLGDFFQISSHNRNGERLDSLQDELDLTNRIRGDVRCAAPDAWIDENEGNHDNRLRSFVERNARALKSLRSIQPEALCAWAENDIHPHGTGGFLLRPHFLVKHGNAVRSEAGASARAELKRNIISGISGHTHRLAMATEDSGYASREWHEQGCLCQLDPDYVPGGAPNWRHGMAVGYFSTVSEAFVVDHVQAIDGRFIYGGRTY